MAQGLAFAGRKNEIRKAPKPSSWVNSVYHRSAKPKKRGAGVTQRRLLQFLASELLETVPGVGNAQDNRGRKGSILSGRSKLRMSCDLLKVVVICELGIAKGAKYASKTRRL